jgi:hypothetical protein
MDFQAQRKKECNYAEAADAHNLRAINDGKSLFLNGALPSTNDYRLRQRAISSEAALLSEAARATDKQTDSLLSTNKH